MPDTDSSEIPERIEYWREVLDRLEEKKISWEDFLEERQPVCDHPAKRLFTSKGQNSLLHLAVLDNRPDLVQLLFEDPQLKIKRNSYGLTPLEVAKFLEYKRCAEILSSPPLSTFLEQPNVTFPSKEPFVDCEFAPHPVFESRETFEEILSITQKAKEEDVIPQERIWMGIYFDKEMQGGYHPPVSIRYVEKEVGFGVFADQRIPSCAFVGEYTGIVREKGKKPFSDDDYSVRYTTWDLGKKKYILDGRKKGNFTRFINHSETPNLCLQSVYWRGIPRMIFVALKEIGQDQQLTFDYGTFFWKECKKAPKLFD